MPNTGTRLSQHIIEVHYNGFVFKGERTSEVITRMHTSGLFSIAELLNIFGIKKQTLLNRIRDYKRKYPEKMEEIYSEHNIGKTFLELYIEEGLTLFEISHVLGTNLAYPYMLKKTYCPNLSNSKTYNMTNRHRQLCHIIFGPQYEPDKNFIEFVLRQLNQLLSKDNYQNILNYYIEGTEHKETADRAMLLRKTSKVINQNISIKNALVDGVICLRRK